MTEFTVAGLMEALGYDPEDYIPIKRNKGMYIDQDPMEDLRFLNLRSHVSGSGICVSHAWSWGGAGTEILVMLHILDGHEEEYQRILDEEE